jgi:hypothetical protein
MAKYSSELYDVIQDRKQCLGIKKVTNLLTVQPHTSKKVPEGVTLTGERSDVKLEFKPSRGTPVRIAFMYEHGVLRPAENPTSVAPSPWHYLTLMWNPDRSDEVYSGWADFVRQKAGCSIRPKGSNLELLAGKQAFESLAGHLALLSSNNCRLVNR